MADFRDLLIIMMSINIMLVLGGALDSTSTREEGNLIGDFYSLNEGGEVGDIDSNFKSEVEGITSKGAVTEGGFEGFTDLPSAASGIFSFLLRSITAPFQLLFNPNLELPFAFRMMIGLPLTIFWIFSLIAYWRQGK